MPLDALGEVVEAVGELAGDVIEAAFEEKPKRRWLRIVLWTLAGVCIAALVLGLLL